VPTTRPFPYGAWPSPLAAELTAAGSVGLGEPRLDGGSVLWAELRPSEGGRTCIVRHDPAGATGSGGGGVAASRPGRSDAPPGDVTAPDVLPPDANARTLVHEYGGGAWTSRDGTVVYADFADQRLYRLDPAGRPLPITPAPAIEQGDRYADLELDLDGSRLWCVRERHSHAGEPANELVVVDLDGSTPPRTVAAGHDFFACPRLSPDRTRLAWISWDHPRMPWDGTELWLGRVTGDGGVADARRVAGGPRESIFQPSWSPEGVLHFVSDRTGWWNLYRSPGDGDGDEPVTELPAELGAPQWVFGQSTYAFLDGGRVACVVNQGGVQRLGVIDRGGLRYPELPFTDFPGPYLASDGRRLVCVAASHREPVAVVLIEPDRGEPDGGEPGVRVLRRSLSIELDRGLISEPEPLEFPTAGGGSAFAVYYPPANPAAAGMLGERPPLLVNGHGGPTAQTPASFSLKTLFWTSRGFAVVHVNYGGSTGYGRAYRERLQGAWGEVDVQDCVAAARHLAAQGYVDPERIAIRGGSAGGYTALCALTFTDVFAAGVSYYGVADATALAAETHKFESRYLDGLIGPLPEAADRYRERSPIHHTDRLASPLLLLQGLEDRIVPPSQAAKMAAALQARGVPFAYLTFEGEQHGFRRVGTIRRCLEAELAFHGHVFGFEPADELPPLELQGLREPAAPPGRPAAAPPGRSG